MSWSMSTPVARVAPWADWGVPSAVSCPASNLCVGVDSYGNVFSSTRPATAAWSSVKVLYGAVNPDPAYETSTQAFTGIDCPSRQLCVATDNHGDIVTSLDPTGPASAWRIIRPTALRKTNAAAIACPSAHLCVAGLGSGWVAISTNPMGGPGTWKRHRLRQHLLPDTIACPSSRLCVISGLGGSDVITLSARANVLHVQPLLGRRSDMVSVSCPSTTLCVGLSTLARIALLAPTSRARPQWRTTSARWAAYESTGSLACPSRNLCLAGVLTTRNRVAVVRSTNPGGGAAAWAPVQTSRAIRSGSIPAPGSDVTAMPALSCVASGPCVALDSEGEAVASTTPAVAGNAWDVFGVDGGNGLPGVACATGSSCLAVAAGAYAAAFGTSGSTLPGVSPVTQFADGNAVACPSASLCVYSDDRGDIYTSTDPAAVPITANAGQVLPVTHNACPDGPDSCTSFVTQNWLACPSTDLCVGFGLDSVGTPYSESSTDPADGAATWNTDATASFEGGPVSCPSVTLCVATGAGAGNGNSIGVTIVPSDGGSWQSAPVDVATARLTGIDCPSASLCVAVDDQGAVLTTTDALDQGSWTRQSIDPGHGLNGVACTPSGACAAYDDRGTVLESATPASAGSWSATSLEAGTDVYGRPIALLAGGCPTNQLCVITDSVGNAFYGTS
jgi:hypothetical protein